LREPLASGHLGGNTLFLLFLFSFVGENLRVLGLVRGRKRRVAAKRHGRRQLCIPFSSVSMAYVFIDCTV